MNHILQRAAYAALSLALSPFALAADPLETRSPGAAPTANPLDVRAPRAAEPFPDSLREGPVLFKLPAGWKRAPSDPNEKNFFRLAPASIPAGKSFVVRVSMGDPADGKNAQKAAQEDVAILSKGQYRHSNTPIAQFKTARGYDAANILHHRTSILRAEDYWLITYIHAGGRNYVLAIATDDKSLISDNAPALQELLDSFQYTNAMVLAPAKDGARALTLQDVYDVSDFFEWLLDVPMTADQRTAIRDLFVDVWSVDAKAGVAALTQAEELRKSIDAMKPEEREALRQAAGPQMAAQFRQAGGVLAKFADIYDAGHKPLVAGDPPLTRQAADANLELIYFMASQVAGGYVSPTTEQKDKWAAELAGRFAKMNQAEKRNLAMMPIIWAGTHAEWPSIPQTERDQKKAEWAKIDTVKQIADGITKARAEAAAAAKANPSTSGGHDPIAFAKAYNKMQTERLQVQMMSNMMAQHHATNMAIIRNMGSQQYTYKYVYRR